MTEQTAEVSGTAMPAQARLAPHRLRLLAFALDLSAMLSVLVAGGLAYVVGEYFVDVGVSVVSVALLILALYLGFGVMNAMLVFLTDGQTVGKAFCGLVERRRAEGPDLGEPAGMARLMGRHTLGYLVIDVFGLGALAAFRLARRRCLHDLVFDTEVTYVGGPEDRLERVKELDLRRQATLSELRARWGWAYRLFKWGSGIVITVVTAMIGLFKGLGWLHPQAPSVPTPAVAATPAAAAPSALARAAVAGLATTATLVAPVAVSGLTSPAGSGTDTAAPALEACPILLAATGGPPDRAIVHSNEDVGSWTALQARGVDSVCQVTQPGQGVAQLSFMETGRWDSGYTLPSVDPADIVESYPLDDGVAGDVSLVRADGAPEIVLVRIELPEHGVAANAVSYSAFDRDRWVSALLAGLP